MKRNEKDKKCYIFDLDGTLIDSLDDLANTVNLLRSGQGLTLIPTEKYRQMVGNGVNKLLQRAFTDASSEDIQIYKEEFDAVYRQKCFEHTRPYSGIIPLLNALKGRNVHLAVLSNKPDRFAKEICHHYFGEDLFSMVLGQSEMFPGKPAPDSLLYLLERLGVQKENAIMIGDSDVDIMTAKQAGIASVGVLWGFRSKDELKKAGASFLIEAPVQLLSLQI